MKTKIIFILISIILAGCIQTPQQARKRIKELAERFPTAIDTVTVTKIDTFYVYKTIEKLIENKDQVKKTYSIIDSLLNELKNSQDTVIIEKIKYKIKNNCTMEGLSKPFVFDTTGVHFSIKYKGNQTILKVILEEKTIKETTNTKTSLIAIEKEFHEITWFWYFIVSCVLCLILLFLLGKQK